MKKMLCLALLVATSMLAGCDDGGYPFVEYHHASYNFDMNNRIIEIPDGYILDQGNSYKLIETENGYDLILHFVKGE